MSEKDRKTAFTMSVMKRKLAKDDGQVNLKEMKKELTSKSEKDVSGKPDNLAVKAHFVLKHTCSVHVRHLSSSSLDVIHG